MSGVDVWAALAELTADYKKHIPQFHAQNRKRMKLTLADFDTALAAVAELVAADREYDEADAAWEALDKRYYHYDLDHRDTTGPEFLRLLAAIARRKSALAAFGGSDV